MKHKEIHERVATGTMLYSVAFGKVIKSRFRLSEVHTSYTGDRTYYTVLEEEHSKQVWVDHSANEWFLSKGEAVTWGIQELKKRIDEWQSQMRMLEKER